MITPTYVCIYIYIYTCIMQVALPKLPIRLDLISTIVRQSMLVKSAYLPQIQTGRLSSELALAIG